MIWLILLLGFFLRMANLLSAKSYWGDEIFSMDLAQKPLSQLIPAALNDVHPPLYPIISHLFSYNEMTLRGLSLIAGMGTVYGVYLMTKELISEKVALLASLLVAVSSYWLQSSNEIRSYSLLACLVTWATYSFFKQWKWAFLTLGLMAVYTEITAIFWIAAIILFTEFDLDMLEVKFWLTIGCIPVIGLTIYQAIFTEHVFIQGRVHEYFNFPMMIKKMGGLADHFACGYRYSMMNWHELMAHKLGLLIHGVFILIFWGLSARGWYRINDESKLIFLSVWFLLPIVVLGLLYPIRLDVRYLSFCAPAFFILVANGI